MEHVLHASKAGFPCWRNLWFSINSNSSELPNVPERTQRIFDVGTALEPVVVQWLRNDGWEVEYNQGSQDAPLELDIPINGGKLTGHPDCIISRTDGLQNVLIDIKTMNDRAFTQWKLEGSIKSKPQYVDQLHIYAQGLINMGRDIQKLGIAAINKNNSQLHIDIFDFDPKRMQDIINRTEYLFHATEPPTDNSPLETWCCGYCEYTAQCSHNKAEVTPADDAQEFVLSEEIIQAMTDLAVARAMTKKAKELEDRAKVVLETQLRQKGVFSVQGGGFSCYIKERTYPRFDSTAFKKVHPDLAGQFTKTCTSVLFDVKEVE